MILPYSYILAIVTPIIGAALVPYIGKPDSKIRVWFAVLCGFLTAFFTLLLVPNITEKPITFEWIPGLITYTFSLDAISVFMAIIAGVIGSLVVLYSVKYMEGQEGLPRYYALTLLFIGAMIGLVLTDNLLILYFFWEIVGLCSYALIGFYHKDPKAAKAGMKAFLTTRVGDVFLLIGILTLYWATNTFSIRDIISTASTIPTSTLSFAGLCFVIGAIGKSAQVPLHVWLPDAMEAPTTISALIHAATMVNAGIYLIARTYPLFHNVGGWLDAIMWIGVITALLAAIMAVVEPDLKRVLAYSTVSQLGFMMFALGVGGYFASQFHLMSHAIFKALLFLCAGAVIHEVGTKNMYEIDGSARSMKITRGTFLIGVFALSGIPIFNGFWSKDMILEAAWHEGKYLHLPLLLAVIAAVFTVAYSFKAYWLVFGKRKEQRKHVHEAHPCMTIPLLLLCFASIVSWLSVGYFSKLVIDYNPMVHIEKINVFGLITETFTNPPVLFTLIAICIGLTAFVYRKEITRSMLTRYRVIYDFVKVGFGFDGLYLWIIRRILSIGRILLHRLEGGLDRFNYGVGYGSKKFSMDFRRTHTGNLNVNLFGIVLGVLMMLIILLYVK
jgi:NADH-quinone oxidoreductase subunit L